MEMKEIGFMQTRLKIFLCHSTWSFCSLMSKGEWNKKWWDASDMDEIISFLSIDAKGGVK
jgi:hypothetical protein